MNQDGRPLESVGAHVHNPAPERGTELLYDHSILDAIRMIKTEHLTKRYHSLTAVEDVSFQVEPGEVLGFLGPNGAGKTTTMRMLAGFITPTSGKASICGHDVETDALRAKASLGYLPEGAPSYGEMTVRRFLEFIADLRKLEGERRKVRICSSAKSSSKASKPFPKAFAAASD
jgi:ABC-type multidrug transport system ATPase subunit